MKFQKIIRSKPMTKQSEQQAQLHKQLWAIANDLRGNMDASEFKNYILGIIFYRYLSENLEEVINKDYLVEDGITYHEAWEKEEYKRVLIEQLIENSNIGYLIEPEYLFSNMVRLIKSGKFDISVLSKAINRLSESTIGHDSQEDFEGLFDDMDLNSNRLGRGEKERSILISKIILKINDIDFMHDDAEIDVLDYETEKEEKISVKLKIMRNG